MNKSTTTTKAAHQIKRRAFAAGIVMTGVQPALAQGFFDKLADQVKSQLAPQQAKEPPAAPRFQDGIPLSTYQQAYDSRFNIIGRAIESPVRGLGLIRLTGDNSPMFINADAKFWGDREWMQYDPALGKSRPIEASDALAVRSEFLSRLKWEMLVGPVRGAGATKKAIVYSAPDCPACVAMEREIDAFAGKLGYELYYLPTRLSSYGRTSFENQVWCSPNRTDAWQQAMKYPNAPWVAAQTCDAAAYTTALINALGIAKEQPDGRVTVSTPTIVLDSGRMGGWAELKSMILTG